MTNKSLTLYVESYMISGMSGTLDTTLVPASTIFNMEAPPTIMENTYAKLRITNVGVKDIYINKVNKFEVDGDKVRLILQYELIPMTEVVGTLAKVVVVDSEAVLIYNTLSIDTYVVDKLIATNRIVTAGRTRYKLHATAAQKVGYCNYVMLYGTSNEVVSETDYSLAIAEVSRMMKAKEI